VPSRSASGLIPDNRGWSDVGKPIQAADPLSSGSSRLKAGEGELRSPGKLKHAPPRRRRRLEMAKLQSRLKAAQRAPRRQDCLPHKVLECR
jgi:hypothetical protein